MNYLKNMMKYLGKRFFFYERYSPIMKRITENIINSNFNHKNDKDICVEYNNSKSFKNLSQSLLIFNPLDFGAL